MQRQNSLFHFSTGTKRRLFGLGVGVLLLGAAAAAHLEIDRAHRHKLMAEARRLAAEAGRRLPDAWAAQTESLALLARSAGTNPPFVAAVRSGVDEKSMLDVITGDDWWAPYRATAAAVSYDGQSVAFAQDREAATVALELLAQPVRERRQAAVSAVMAGGRALLVAGAPIAISRMVSPAMVLLAQPLDRQVLSGLAARLGGPLLLEGIGGELGEGGSPDDVARLTVAVRKGGLDARAGEVPWAASAIPIGRGLWLWTGATPEDFARDLAVASAAAKLAMWSAAAVAFLLAVGLSWRRPRQAAVVEAPAEAEDTTPTPAPPVEVDRAAPARRTFLGRYELLEQIGEGGMAEIFAAASFGSNGFRRFFVVKRLRAALASNQDAVAHFIDEANLGSTLVHPNIVPVFDFGEVDGTYFLAEEYVLGRDLGRLRRRMVEREAPPLPPAAVLYVVDEILAALEYAHRRCDEDGVPLDIVHRDVTPANVLVSATGEVKLLDFGIVKTSRGRLSQTQIGAVNGNLEFMAPEQARSQAVDARTDLFSLGLVAYYAASADRLYRGESLLDLLNRAAVGPGVDELGRIAALPEPLPALLDRALAVDPAERCQTAAEFRAAIAPHLEGGKAALLEAMTTSFGDELQREKERLTRACPRPARNTPAPVAA